MITAEKMTAAQAREKLVLALDFSSRELAWPVMERLRGHAGLFKVGMQLFTCEGPGIVRDMVTLGERVFLDLKYHDIPNTVSGAISAASDLGVSLVNVHAAGGPEMMEAAARAARGSGMKVLGVTALTSLDAGLLRRVGFAEEPDRLVLRLARLALESGLDGVVAAATEIAPLRRTIGPNFLILTPGIRPADSGHQDQKRVATPGQAVRDGADYIVVGRPVTAERDSAAAADAIVQMMLE